VLNGEDISETIRTMIRSTIEDNVALFASGDEPGEWNLEALTSTYRAYLLEPNELNAEEMAQKKMKSKDLAELLVQKAERLYAEKEELFGKDVFKEVERALLLQSVDRYWMEHIDAMDDLKGSIGLQAYAQRDPVNEYRIQGSMMFEEMVTEIREETVRHVLTAIPRPQPIARVQIAKPLQEGFEGTGEGKKTVVVRKAEKVGRNDLCPCGSGKKYKKCCGAAGQADQN
jgi:preprotein translocase subunit SecA